MVVVTWNKKKPTANSNSSPCENLDRHYIAETTNEV